MSWCPWNASLRNWFADLRRFGGDIYIEAGMEDLNSRHPWSSISCVEMIQVARAASMRPRSPPTQNLCALLCGSNTRWPRIDFLVDSLTIQFDRERKHKMPQAACQICWAHIRPHECGKYKVIKFASAFIGSNPYMCRISSEVGSVCPCEGFGTGWRFFLFYIWRLIPVYGGSGIVGVAKLQICTYLCRVEIGILSDDLMILKCGHESAQRQWRSLLVRKVRVIWEICCHLKCIMIDVLCLWSVNHSQT